LFEQKRLGSASRVRVTKRNGNSPEAFINNYNLYRCISRIDKIYGWYMPLMPESICGEN
jgi:hypothetical protein